MSELETRLIGINADLVLLNRIAELERELADSKEEVKYYKNECRLADIQIAELQREIFVVAR